MKNRSVSAVIAISMLVSPLAVFGQTVAEISAAPFKRDCRFYVSRANGDGTYSQEEKRFVMDESSRIVIDYTRFKKVRLGFSVSLLGVTGRAIVENVPPQLVLEIGSEADLSRVLTGNDLALSLLTRTHTGLAGTGVLPPSFEVSDSNDSADAAFKHASLQCDTPRKPPVIRVEPSPSN